MTEARFFDVPADCVRYLTEDVKCYLCGKVMRRCVVLGRRSCVCHPGGITRDGRFTCCRLEDPETVLRLTQPAARRGCTPIDHIAGYEEGNVPILIHRVLLNLPLDLSASNERKAVALAYENAADGDLIRCLAATFKEHPTRFHAVKGKYSDYYWVKGADCRGW